MELSRSLEPQLEPEPVNSLELEPDKESRSHSLELELAPVNHSLELEPEEHHLVNNSLELDKTYLEQVEEVAEEGKTLPLKADNLECFAPTSLSLEG